jgi:hypothetical protein
VRRLAVAALALTFSTASLVGLWLAFRSAPRDRLGSGPIDLDPRVTAVVPVGPFPQDLAVGEGAVWVGVPAQPPKQDRQLIVRIDPATNDVVARIPMDDYIEELAAGEGGVWGNAVAGTAADPAFSIVRIDPATNEVVATIQDVSGPLAVGEGALWAVDRAGARAGTEGSTLLRIDPGTLWGTLIAIPSLSRRNASRILGSFQPEYRSFLPRYEAGAHHTDLNRTERPRQFRASRRV